MMITWTRHTIVRPLHGLMSGLLLAGATIVAPHSASAAPCVTVTPDGARRCYATIQAAVDAAPQGATVTIRPGTYTEQVNVGGKSLTITGYGATVRAPQGMVPNIFFAEAPPKRAVIGVGRGATVTIRGVTVDGANSAETNTNLVGIGYQFASGTIQDTTVTNIGFGTPRAPRELPDESGIPVLQAEGQGIYVGIDFDATPPEQILPITIENNTVSNYNFQGIEVYGGLTNDNGQTYINATVRNNRVTGSGATNAIGQTGISFDANGSLKDNTVKDNVYTGDESRACGIATEALGGNTVDSNELTNNSNGLCVDFNVSAREFKAVNNRISGPRPKAKGFVGIYIDGGEGTARVERHTFTNLEIGISTFSTINLQQKDNTYNGVKTKVRVRAE